MRSIDLNAFFGMAPRLGQHMKTGYAQVAENCDLSSQKIRAMADAELIQADANQYNALHSFNAAWEMGNDRYFMDWKIGDYDLLIYLLDGVPYKKIGSVSAPLGQTRLTAPTVADNGAGSLDDTFTYFITTTRSVNGYTDESGPSATAEITVASKKVLVTRPAITDDLVTLWNIYRVSNSSGSYQFVADVDADTATYDDNIEDADLDTSPTTWYTSDQGNQIVFDKPQVLFDGLINEPISGTLFGWKGSTLYWNEPGIPDAWPSFFNMNFPSDIKRVFSLAGALGVLTAKGPHRVDGTHPELLQPSKALGKEPCIGTAACVASTGIHYLSDSGLVRFNLVDTRVLSDAYFTEAWFKANVAASGAHMIENDGQIYLFHSAGALVVDTRPRLNNWYTLSPVAYAAYKMEDTGEIYTMDATGVQKLHGGTGSLTWTWASGYLDGRAPYKKPFDSVIVNGFGTVTLTVYADDVEIAQKALAWARDRDRTLKLPAGTMATNLEIHLTGTGGVNDVRTIFSP